MDIKVLKFSFKKVKIWVSISIFEFVLKQKNQNVSEIRQTLLKMAQILMMIIKRDLPSKMKRRISHWTIKNRIFHTWLQIFKLKDSLTDFLTDLSFISAQENDNCFKLGFAQNSQCDFWLSRVENWVDYGKVLKLQLCICKQNAGNTITI